MDNAPAIHRRRGRGPRRRHPDHDCARGEMAGMRARGGALPFRAEFPESHLAARSHGIATSSRGRYDKRVPALFGRRAESAGRSAQVGVQATQNSRDRSAGSRAAGDVREDGPRRGRQGVPQYGRITAERFFRLAVEAETSRERAPARPISPVFNRADSGPKRLILMAAEVRLLWRRLPLPKGKSLPRRRKRNEPGSLPGTSKAKIWTCRSTRRGASIL